MSSRPWLDLQDYGFLNVSIRANEDYEESEPVPPQLSTFFVANRHVSRPELFRLECRFALEEDENPDQPYWFSTQLIAVFASNIEFTDDDVPGPLVENALTILYGLARGTIASISGMSFHGKYLMPTVSFKDATEEATLVNREVVSDAPKQTQRKAQKRPRTTKKAKS